MIKIARMQTSGMPVWSSGERNLMWFWNIDEVWWGEVQSQDQARILEPSLMQNGGFIKAQGTGPLGRRSCCPGVFQGWLILYLEVGGGKGKGGFKRIFLC